MHDDRTRVMGQPDDPGDRPHGNMRLLIAGLIAVIVGLVVAIVVIAGGDGETTSVPSEITTLPTRTDETAETTEPTTTDETTSPTTTTGTEPTTTTETTAPPEEEDGSGGIEAP